jgi:hypothetical protein
MTFEGSTIPPWFLQVELQREVQEAGYDAGAEILMEFFHKMLQSFNEDGLSPLGRQIIECCLDGGTVTDYEKLMHH